MTERRIGRRAFMGSALATTALGGTAAAGTARTSDSGFVYEVVRSEEEWRKMLEPIEFFVLRGRNTEGPRTSALWNNTETGSYSCKGCDLTLYDSRYKIELDKGWVFFRHAETESVLTGIDRSETALDADPFADAAATMEVRCRRCGSHLGHIVALPEVPGKPIHCINGFALNFTAAAA